MSEFIDLQEAVDLTSTYRGLRSKIIDPGYSEDIIPICETFDKDQVLDLLKQTNCTGLRVYLGAGTDDIIRIVLVGTDDNGADILTTHTELIVEKGNKFPPHNPPQSPLNS